MSKIKKPALNKNTNPKDMKRLDCSMVWDTKSIKKSANGRLTIKGYANTKDRDRVGDVVLPEAFKNQLPEYMENPILLFMHDWDRPCGKVVSAIIDDKGLLIEAEITNAKSAEDIREMVKDGTLKTFSIGYNELDSDWDKDTATNYVKEIELLEISIVTIPCNTQAKFEVKPDIAIPEPEEEEEEEGKSASKSIVITNVIDPDMGEFMAQMINMMDSSEEIDSDLIVDIAKAYNHLKNSDSELIDK